MIGMPIIVNEKRIYNPKKIIVNQIIPIIIKTENNYYNFLFTMNNSSYKDLVKPINIKEIVFPIVWVILYILMSISIYIIN